MIIFLAGLANIPDDVLEAARLDGANHWQTFWCVKLPLLKEVIYVALLICFTGAFKAFDLFAGCCCRTRTTPALFRRCS